MVEGEIDRGSDTWNVAKGFTQLKILKPLVEMDGLVKVALYGSENVEETIFLNQNPEMKVTLRVDAMRRLVDVLRELIENSHFALSKEDKKIMDNLEIDLNDIEEVLDALTTRTTDQRTGVDTVKINEPHFIKCLNALRTIKKEIATPLNNNKLIFPSSDEIDLSKIEEQLEYGG